MDVFSTCTEPRCGVTIAGRPTTCPSCGRPMRLVRESAVRGWVLLGLGLFLVVFMAVISMSIVPQMLRPGEEVDGTTFTGTAEQAQLIFALFAAVILFGATSMAYGLFIIVTGRQSRAFIGATLAIAGLLFVLGWGITAALG